MEIISPNLDSNPKIIVLFDCAKKNSTSAQCCGLSAAAKVNQHLNLSPQAMYFEPKRAISAKILNFQVPTAMSDDSKQTS